MIIVNAEQNFIRMKKQKKFWLLISKFHLKAEFRLQRIVNSSFHFKNIKLKHRFRKIPNTVFE